MTKTDNIRPVELDDLSDEQLVLVENKIRKLVDGALLLDREEFNRTHLGGSLIGSNCDRYLWYVFRWCVHEEDCFTDEEENYSIEQHAKMLRLFERGHLEEDRFGRWLTRAGFKVYLYADEEKQEQFKISDVNGHFGGSLDGILQFPQSWDIKGFALAEFKTYNKKQFEKLIHEKKPIPWQQAKPLHWAQTCTYGCDPKYNLNHVLYMAVCKDDDRLYIKLERLDHEHGKIMRKKALRVIQSQEPPRKYSMNATIFECKYCDARKVCHEGKEVPKNCRSCKYAIPITNPTYGVEQEWICGNTQQGNGYPIPESVIKTGCNFWESINADPK